MQHKGIEIFYLFFQGVLVFQALMFAILYFITSKNDILYYSLFLLFTSLYFFVNAPYTFFGIPEEIVWTSTWYDYVNTPLIIIENLFYLLFLKAFFNDFEKGKLVNRVLVIVLWFVPILIILFVLLTVLNISSQSVFYIVKMITVVPSAIVIYALLKEKSRFTPLIIYGLASSIIGTCVTVFMIILRNYHIHHLFTDGYPLFFIRIGILGDMIFYMAAILKKWHLQEKQLAVEKLQSQLAVEKLRNKISGELHDDLGANLSGISMYSHIINDLIRSHRYQEAIQSVNIIQKSANEMTVNLSDLVWAIRPEHDNLNKLFEKLEAYAYSMGNAKQIEVRIRIPANITDEDLLAEARRNIYLICKEAINNAVKYSNATLLELIINTKTDTIEFLIKDNGGGFTIDLIKRGNGLDNMQKRADEMGALLIIQSLQNEGTAVRLIYKITQRGIVRG